MSSNCLLLTHLKCTYLDQGNHLFSGGMTPKPKEGDRGIVSVCCYDRGREREAGCVGEKNTLYSYIFTLLSHLVNFNIELVMCPLHTLSVHLDFISIPKTTPMGLAQFLHFGFPWTAADQKWSICSVLFSDSRYIGVTL